MWNSNMELDLRIQRVEKLLENYRSTIEPKSWEFIWQNWYNEATEVLNVWNWKAFTPAYWNSIVQDLNWFETRISQNEFDIEFSVVQNDEVVSAINLSNEWIRILWNRITLDWNVNVTWTFTISDINSTLKNTDFLSGSNPSNWVIFDSNWIRWYKSNSQTFWIDAAWNAVFTWTIYANWWDILWDLIMWASWWVKSSNYNWTNWWLLDNTWLTIWVDKEINIRPGWWVFVWSWWPWPKVFIENWGISIYQASLATPAVLTSTFAWELLVNWSPVWGWWDWNATSNLDMNNFDIIDIDDITTNSWSIVTLNWRLKIPVWTNLY